MNNTAKQFLTTRIIIIVCIMLTGICGVRPGYAQTILVATHDTIKIKKALQVIESFEPEIFNSVIRNSMIQFGILSHMPTVNFAISEDKSYGGRHWIMLNPMLMKHNSINIIASVILHESMHLAYNMNMYVKPPFDDFQKALFHEHIHIYNYELSFLKKIGAVSTDILSRKRVMSDLSIPIL